MTEEQIDLELEHWKLDNADKLRGKEVFTDYEYENYDKDSDDLDSRVTEGVVTPSQTAYNEDDWEDV
jgi:hypothetical protein